jgi:hypothetical protein
MRWQGLAGEQPLPLRASDAERDQVVGELRERFAEGRLSQDSFVRRVDAALRARERRELAGLLADMPASRRLAGALADVARRAAAAARRAGGRWQAAGPPAARRPALMFPAGPGRLFTIGRDGGCDLVLADVTVSRRHARLERDGSNWVLQDLGSTNGTRLNGWLVSGAVPVQAGDQVSFGEASFVLADGR